MDCMEAIALKSSLRTEVSVVKSSAQQQVFFDDVIWCSATGEDFPIDDLLDFSNQDFVVEEDDEEEEEIAKSVENDSGSISAGVSDTPVFGVGFADELAEPVDDMENLEWVSRFVDDSISEFPVQHPAGKEKTGNFSENRSKPGSKPALLLGPLCFPSTIPVKPRTKRSRPVGKVWSPESSRFYNPVQTMDLFYGSEKPPVKKQKKRPAARLGETGGLMQFQRRCSHCQVNKTPQWRTGPHGAKTLCNACGVRFKSGRLYPEYRPACSPTFSGDIHSNSHRKVLEIRQKKEVLGPESGLVQMVLTC